MAKYTSVTVSGYNATPPSDDGTVSEANKIKWATHKTKIGDPLKTAIEAINTNNVSAADVGPTALTTSTTLGATHYGDFVQTSGASLTHTLTDAATLGAGWHIHLRSTDTNNLILARATGADTINGVASNKMIVAGDSGTIFVNASANGFFTEGFTSSVQPLQLLVGTRYGNIWSHNATDVSNDWDITAGGCMDSTQAYWIKTAALIKQADVAWAVGTNAGMLDTGAVANSDYYIWAIARSDTGVTDYLSSLSSTAPTMPTNYDYKRLVGWFKRVAGVNVLMNVYETEGGGVEVLWKTLTTDAIMANTLTNTRRLDAAKVPLNFSVYSHILVGITDGAFPSVTLICSPDLPDSQLTPGASPGQANFTSSTAVPAQSDIWVRTDSSGQIAARSSIATVDDYRFRTLGFKWARRN